MRLKGIGFLILFFILGLIQTVNATVPGGGNILVSAGDRVLEYSQNGVLLRTIVVQYPNGGYTSIGGQTYPIDPAGQHIRDLVYIKGAYYNSSRIGTYDGTDKVFRGNYNYSSDYWSFYPNSSTGIPGLSTSTDLSTGGIALDNYGTYYYMTDMATGSDGGVRGLVRLEATAYNPSTYTRFASEYDFTDVALDPSDVIYGLDNDHMTVRVYSSSNLAFLRNVVLPAALDIRGIAVSSSGNIFGISSNGTIYCFNSTGQQINSLNTGFINLNDIDISSEDKLLVSSTDGRVILTDQTLAQMSSFQTSATNIFVAFGGFSLSGYVKDAQGNPISGVQMGSTTTNADGFYYLGPYAPDSYVGVTPSRQYYDFSPYSFSINSMTQSITKDFVGTMQLFYIQVYISSGYNTVDGITVRLTGGKTATGVTDQNGNYTFANLTPGLNYTVTVDSPFDMLPASENFNPLTYPSGAHFSVSSRYVSGRVTDSNNNGLANATVTLSGDRSATRTTDNQGYYSIGNVLYGGSYTVTVTKPLYNFDPATLTHVNGQTLTQLNFTGTLQAFAISGHVVDSGGNAIAGADIALSGGQTGTTQTDTNGNYTFTNLTANSAYTVTPTKTYYNFAPPSTTINSLTSNSTANFTGTLQTFAISGTVNDGNGVGQSGVTMTLSGGQTGSVQTDVNGNYTFTNLAAGGSYTVTPSKTYYNFDTASTTINPLTNNGTANFVATLQNFSISGTITDNGAPLANVTVTLSGSQSGSTTTDVNGNYSFTNLPAGSSYTVTATKTYYNFAPASTTINPLANNSNADFSASLQRYAVSGTVTNSSGVGLSDVTMTLSGGQSGSVQTDANGNYTFTNLAAGGAYTITPAKLYYNFDVANKTFDPLTNDATANFVATLQNFSISGTITDNGSPLANVTVTLSGNQTGSTTTDASGHYSFANLPAGSSYTVTATKTYYNFAPASTTINPLANNSNADFSASLQRYLISGTVANGSGVGLSGVTMTLSGGQSGSVQTDANGNYSFTNLAAGGSYTITPAKLYYNFNPVNTTINPLSNNGTANFVGTLQSYSISGRVTLGGASFSGVTVTLSGNQSGTVTTDANGNYVFNNLPAGATYTITPSKTVYAFTPVTTTINPLNSNAVVNITGALQTFTISGRVTDAAGNGLSGATLTLSGSQSGSVVTTSTGNYSFSNLSAGSSFSVMVSKANHTFTPSNQNFNQLSGNQTQDFRLTSVTITITDDAYVRNGNNANTNYGNDTSLQVVQTTSANANREAFIKFDLSQFGGQITSAQLKLNGNLNAGSPTISISASGVATTSWVENSITWNNRPSSGANLSSVTVNSTSATLYTWNVTSWVAAEKSAGHNVISIALKGTSSSSTTNYATFKSAEASSNKPVIVITFQ